MLPATTSPVVIQIQHLLKLNGNSATATKLSTAIQIQHLLKLNITYNNNERSIRNSNTTLVKVKCQ